jgi:hypothetical protein
MIDLANAEVTNSLIKFSCGKVCTVYDRHGRLLNTRKMQRKKAGAAGRKWNSMESNGNDGIWGERRFTAKVFSVGTRTPGFVTKVLLHALQDH